MSQKVLLTGAAGRVGSVVAKHLFASGFDIIATDRRPAPNREFPVRIADLLAPAECYRLVEGIDTVVHLGNLPSPITAPPQEIYSKNCAININLLEACAACDVPRVLFASTIQVLGKLDPVAEPERLHLPLDGNTAPRPENTYALSKLATEQMLRYYGDRNGIHSIAFRLPYMRSQPAQKPPAAFGSKLEQSTRIDFLLCLDALDFARLVAATLETKLEGCRIWFPVCNHTPTDTLHRDYLREHPQYAPILPKTQRLVDISAITQATGWTPEN